MRAEHHGRLHLRALRDAGGLLALLAGVWLPGGCQLVGGTASARAPEPPPASPAPPPPETEEATVPLPQGEFRGEILVEGEALQAHLILQPEGDDELQAILEGPVDFRARGQGEVHGNKVHLRLSYGGDCPGTMILEGSWDPEARSYTGIIRASDCTGEGQGTFRFQGAERDVAREGQASLTPIPAMD